jgi:hypothetical protein
VFPADALAIGGDVELTVYRPAIRPLAGAHEPHPVFRRCDNRKLSPVWSDAACIIYEHVPFTPGKRPTP